MILDLSEKKGGPMVDIQQTMARRGSLDEIRAYCRKMVKYLWKPGGGFIPRWYSDPVGVGHTSESLDAMVRNS